MEKWKGGGGRKRKMVVKKWTKQFMMFHIIISHYDVFVCVSIFWIDKTSSGKCDKNRQVHFILFNPKRNEWIFRRKNSGNSNCVVTEWNRRQRRKKNKNNKIWVAFNGRMIERWFSSAITQCWTIESINWIRTNTQQIRFNDDGTLQQ